jgi:hypothetical protein
VREPRAPRSRPRAATGFSYAAVLKAPMERVNPHGNGNRGGFQRRFGGSAAGQGSGQGTMFGRGGYPAASGGFHPGHGGHGPYMGGGGHFGGRDHLGGWAPQQRPTYGDHGGRVIGATEGSSSSFGDPGSRDWVGAEAGGHRLDIDGKSKTLSLPNSTKAVGALSLGGRTCRVVFSRC